MRPLVPIETAATLCSARSGRSRRRTRARADTRPRGAHRTRCERFSVDTDGEALAACPRAGRCRDTFAAMVVLARRRKPSGECFNAATDTLPACEATLQAQRVARQTDTARRVCEARTPAEGPHPEDPSCTPSSRPRRAPRPSGENVEQGHLPRRLDAAHDAAVDLLLQVREPLPRYDVALLAQELRTRSGSWFPFNGWAATVRLLHCAVGAEHQQGRAPASGSRDS